MIKKLINKKSNNIWNESVRKLINNELSVEEFANKNAKKQCFIRRPLVKIRTANRNFGF